MWVSITRVLSLRELNNTSTSLSSTTTTLSPCYTCRNGGDGGAGWHRGGSYAFRALPPSAGCPPRLILPSLTLSTTTSLPRLPLHNSLSLHITFRLQPRSLPPTRLSYHPHHAPFTCCMSPHYTLPLSYLSHAAAFRQPRVRLCDGKQRRRPVGQRSTRSEGRAVDTTILIPPPVCDHCVPFATR